MTEVKMNFKLKHQNLYCNLCKLSCPQSDAHLLDCQSILNNCQELSNSIEIEYEDIFGGPVLQLKVTRLFSLVFETKENLDEEV